MPIYQAPQWAVEVIADGVSRWRLAIGFRLGLVAPRLKITARERLEILAAQARFARFLDRPLLIPAQFNQIEDHHVRRDPFDEGAIYQHRMIAFVAQQSEELVDLFVSGEWRANR